MLPKVASHIFHQTSRAAATAQNYALRNVLGIQPPATSGTVSAWNSTGSSSWGAYGAGAGGAKYSTGSRFYQGYTGAGRAVTQGTTTGRTDDEDDFVLPWRPVRVPSQNLIRGRSNSLTLGHHGRVERSDSLTVLRTAQLHQTRSKHTVAKTLAIESAPLVHTEATASSVTIADVSNNPLTPKHARRNSTSSVESLDLNARDIPPPPLPQTTQVAAEDVTPNTDPSAPQSTTPPRSISSTAKDENDASCSGTYKLIRNALASRSRTEVQSAVSQLLSSPKHETIDEYNMALQALFETREYLEPLQPLLEVYNTLLDHGLVPNARTYSTLVFALCTRDREVHAEIDVIKRRLSRRALMNDDDFLSTGQHLNEEKNDRALIASFEQEDNLRSATKLFEALIGLWGRSSTTNSRYKALHTPVYTHMLRSCAISGNIDLAIRVFSHLERSFDGKPTIQLFHHLLRTYVTAGDIQGAETVFAEYRRQVREGVLTWESRNVKNQRTALCFWNEMISGYFRARQPVKAIALLEEMLDSPALKDFGPRDIPPPCAHTFTAFIEGFISIGDVDSAMKWFERMMAQPLVEDVEGSALNADEKDYIPLKTTPRPNEVAWTAMVTSLAKQGLVPQLNRVYAEYVAAGLTPRSFDAPIIIHANIRYIRSHPELSVEEQDYCFELITQLALNIRTTKLWKDGEAGSPGVGVPTNVVTSLAMLLMEKGRDDAVLNLLEAFAKGQEESRLQSPNGDFRTKYICQVCQLIIDAITQRPHFNFGMALRIGKLHEIYGLNTELLTSARIMHQFYIARDANMLPALSLREWESLNRAIRLLVTSQSELVKYGNDGLLPAGFQFRGYKDFLRSWASAIPHAGDIRDVAANRVSVGLVRAYGAEDAMAFLNELGPEWLSKFGAPVELAASVSRIASNPESSGRFGMDPRPASERPTARFDLQHSRYVDEYFPAHPRITPEMAMERYEYGLSQGKYPGVQTIGRLIQTFGRMHDVSRVHKLYQDGQYLLFQLESDKAVQSLNWYLLEDQMIIALAHAGDIESAHVHKQRILDQGGTPSNDAYGALIQCVKETTDDSTNALALWEESQARGVVANQYLYNTIISKLSKARKTDLALDLFQQMKANYVRPSSVTYGAVIAACCRVGDAHSAEALFEEMVSQQNFKPRIPPYNTMIQFYTHTVRNRERALHYFGELIKTDVKPTAHTYKLLIDCYGTLEPVDMASMQDVFTRLMADRNVQVQGVHWAALINAWGCMQKNLDKAVEVFDSIESHPSTRASGHRLPDAVTYEAMINVLVTLRRTDLMPEFLERLTSSGVHMTAYIANLLIKGFAANGDLDRAREVFESLSDPPVGVAAPNNHLPHEVSPNSTVAPGAPVFREPSTWEAMVRAELGAGNREQAVALLQRVQARHFPPAVYQRISGIMHDDTISPLTPDSGSQSPY